MKKIFLVLMIMMKCFSSFSQSPYIPIPFTNSVYHSFHHYTTNLEQCTYEEYRNYLHDTTINGYTYAVFVSYYHNRSCPNNLGVDGFLSFFRNDSLARKVYTLNSFGDDGLYFDYSVGVGDTAHLYDSNYQWVVYSIDSIPLANGWHRRFIVKDGGYELQFVEGVGEIKYFIFEKTAHLLCYSVDSNTIYHDSLDSSYCYLPLSVPYPDMSEPEVNFYPNTIKIRVQNGNLKLLNMQGQVMEDLNFHDYLEYTPQVPSGLYLAVVNSDRKRVVRKIRIE